MQGCKGCGIRVPNLHGKGKLCPKCFREKVGILKVWEKYMRSKTTVEKYKAELKLTKQKLRLLKKEQR